MVSRGRNGQEPLGPARKREWIQILVPRCCDYMTLAEAALLGPWFPLLKIRAAVGHLPCTRHTGSHYGPGMRWPL